jgi:hypothetical protein
LKTNQRDSFYTIRNLGNTSSPQWQQAEKEKLTQLADATEPCARSAHYNRASGNIVIHLKDGSTFMFPHLLGQGLANAEPDDLAAVEITGSGLGLY